MCDGVDLEGTNYNNRRYADDTALIAYSEEKLQRLLKVVAKESERLGSWFWLPVRRRRLRYVVWH